MEPHTKPVFQYVGGLDKPAMIGLVDKDGQRTTLSTSSRYVQFWDSGPGGTQFDLLDTAHKTQACQLVHTWESHRYLRRQP